MHARLQYMKNSEVELGTLSVDEGLSSKMCKFIFFPYRQFSELPVLYARINTVHT